MVSVASSSSCTSASRSGARSSCEYCFAAATSAEIRRTASSISSSSACSSTAYASQRSTPASAPAPTRRSTPAAQPASRPAPASSGARSPLSGTVRASPASRRARPRRRRRPAGRGRDGPWHVAERSGPQRLGGGRRRGPPGQQPRRLQPGRGQPLPQRRDRRHRGRGRVVQLVGEPGGERAEGGQPLALAEQVVGRPHPGHHALDEVYGHREPGPGPTRPSPAPRPRRTRTARSPAGWSGTAPRPGRRRSRAARRRTRPGGRCG